MNSSEHLMAVVFKGTFVSERGGRNVSRRGGEISAPASLGLREEDLHILDEALGGGAGRQFLHQEGDQTESC